MAIDPRRFDAALAAVLLAGALAEAVLLRNPDGASRPLSAVVAVVLIGSLVFRRAHPFALLLGTMATLVASTQLDTLYLTEMTSSYLALGVVFYSLGRYAPDRELRVGAAVGFAGVVAITLLSDTNPEQPPLITALWGIALLGSPVLVGRVMRRRVEMQDDLRALTARLEAEGERRAEQAVRTERGRIAEELQTLVANNVSAMVVQAGVVRPALALPAPQTARTALATVEETGRDALVEMRRLLGVLRRDGDRAELAPQPSLGRAEALVERVRGGGLPVAFAVEGDDRELPAGVDLAAYRVLAEALDSAAHAEAVTAAEVRVVYAQRDVTVVVRDDRPGGKGLDAGVEGALRERVGLYGGTLRAGPSRRSPGYRVSARLPRYVPE